MCSVLNSGIWLKFGNPVMLFKMHLGKIKQENLGSVHVVQVVGSCEYDDVPLDAIKQGNF
jgi:hypothetical protein